MRIEMKEVKQRRGCSLTQSDIPKWVRRCNSFYLGKGEATSNLATAKGRLNSHDRSYYLTHTHTHTHPFTSASITDQWPSKPLPFSLLPKKKKKYQYTIGKFGKQKGSWMLEICFFFYLNHFHGSNDFTLGIHEFYSALHAKDWSTIRFQIIESIYLL